MSRASQERRRRARAARNGPAWSKRDTRRILTAFLHKGDEAYRILSEGGLTGDALLEAEASAREGDLITLGRYRQQRDRISAYRAPKLACREGCSWCCRGPQVLVPAHEVFGLVAWMRDHLSPEEMAAVRDRALAATENFDREILTLSDNQAAPRVACPLLVADRCSVYPARPGVCRGWNSYDSHPCQAYAEGDDDTVQVCDPNMLQMGQMTLGSVTEMLSGTLMTAQIDLPSALVVVLDNPHALDDYIAGQPIFADAVRRAQWTSGWRQAREAARLGHGATCELPPGSTQAPSP